MPNHVSARKQQRQRPCAVRKPKKYAANIPGDIVEVDTLDVRPLPGIVLKQFTTRDIILRWDVRKLIAGRLHILRLALLTPCYNECPSPLVLSE